MSGPAPSPLARLVLFMICLSIAGSILAGAHYYAIDQPAQQAAAIRGPANAANSWTNYDICMMDCQRAEFPYMCMSECDVVG